MSLRTRLLIFIVLFGSAVLTNIVALVYLARSISKSLNTIEDIRQRQLVGVEMNSHLRDAEAALYRYQIDGEAGFKTQFLVQLSSFSSDLQKYDQLGNDPSEQQWTASLGLAYRQIYGTGNNLIALRDRQLSHLEAFLAAQSGLTALLFNEVKPNRVEDAAYQAIVTDMQDASRAMLSAVTSYIASPEETKRVQFTDAAVSFQKGIGDFRGMAHSQTEKQWAEQITGFSSQMQSLGSQLISERDLQQSLYANFISIMFTAGQQTIVGQIEPYETAKFTREQRALLSAVNRAIFLSIGLTAVISLLAVVFMMQLSREINARATALLEGAERVRRGNLGQPVPLKGRDEFGRLAESFNTMMQELSNREDRLRALIGRLAHIQDEERRLIGLDLHDGLTQLIISANMHLNALNAQIGSKLRGPALQALDVSRTLVRQSIDEARRVISELRPTVIDDLGLEQGLRQYVTELCEGQKWEAEIVTETHDLTIARPVGAAIFRIAQEALANVRKHARTKKVRVQLTVEDQCLVLCVQDWGKGFDTSLIGREEGQHLGLVSMQERAGMMNGVCKIESQVRRGTNVEVRIPLESLVERSGDGR